MKKMLTAVSLLLIAAMVFATGIFAAPVLPFDDIGDCPWAADAISVMYEKGIMRGTSETKFSPNGSITLAEFATTAYRVAGCPEVPEKSDKYNIYGGSNGVDSEDYWAYDTITWAVQNGVIETIYAIPTGYLPSYINFRWASDSDSDRGQSSVNGNAKLTRGEIVLGLYFLAEYLHVNREDRADVSSFRDRAELDKYGSALHISYGYTDYHADDCVVLDPAEVFGWAVAVGIVKGYDDNTLRSLEYVTRAEYAAMFGRFIEYAFDTTLPQYEDLGDFGWAAEAIAALTEKKIMNGTGKTSFSPRGDITVAEFATTAYRIAGYPSVPGKSDRYDICNMSANAVNDTTDWAYGPCVWAVENGIIQTVYGIYENGFDEIFGYWGNTPTSFINLRWTGYFFGDDSEHVEGFRRLTRREIVLGLYFLADYFRIDLTETADITGFADCNAVTENRSKVQHISCKYIDCRQNGVAVSLHPAEIFGWAVAAGIVKGDDDNMLRPDENVNRAEYAVMLDRFLKYIGK